MNYRAICGVVVIVILAFELYLFMNQETPRTTVSTSSGHWSGSKIVIDYEMKELQDRKYMILIGATLLGGGVLTFSLPTKKTTSAKKEEEG